MQATPINVYIAGPDVFFPNAEAHFASVEAKLAAHGLRARVPVDGGLSKGAPLNRETALAICKGNYQLIRECQVVLANLNPFRGMDPDSGTCAEVGYAKGIGKLIVAYTDSPEPYAERVRRNYGSHVDGELGIEVDDRDGCIIENFGLPCNLMLTFGTNFVTEGLDAAIAKLVEVVKQQLRNTEHA
jgi:nucleoside 2-deoxyribosyltransferase